MKLSNKGLALLKRLEGKRLKAYADSAGNLTIGYGHIGMVDSKPITKDLSISEEKAEQLLAEDCSHFAEKISPLIKVKLEQHQFDALLIFAFNIGVRAFKNSSALSYLNSGKGMLDVAARMALYNKITIRGRKVILPGLVKRRTAEIKLLLEEVYDD